jgi:hypothetical protein
VLLFILIFLETLENARLCDGDKKAWPLPLVLPGKERQIQESK